MSSLEEDNEKKNEINKLIEEIKSAIEKVQKELEEAKGAQKLFSISYFVPIENPMNKCNKQPMNQKKLEIATNS